MKKMKEHELNELLKLKYIRIFTLEDLPNVGKQCQEGPDRSNYE